MVIKFSNDYLEKLFEGKPILGKPKYSSEVVVKFKKTILRLRSASDIKEIKSFNGLNYEALKGKLKGYYSVRVNKGFRLIFSVDKENGLSIKDVLTIHDLNNHYQ